MTDNIIVDIDGTLSDPSHRRHHVEGENNEWEEFFRKVENDTVNRWSWEIVQRFSKDKEIILVTGRPEISKDGINVKEKTERWLKSCKVPYDSLVMRPEGDFREDTIVKKELLEEKLPDPENILFAVDDREDIAEMWRNHGITCLQCKDEVKE